MRACIIDMKHAKVVSVQNLIMEGKFDGNRKQIPANP